MAKNRKATDAQMLSFVSAEVAAASAETAGAVIPPHLGAEICPGLNYIDPEKKRAFGSFRSNFFYWPIARSSIVAFDSTRWRLLTLKTD